MRVGLDARILAHPRSGIAVYVVNLIRELLKYPDVDIALFSDKPICDEYASAVKGTEVVVFGQSHRRLWAQFSLPGQLKKLKIDIYHATWNNAVPILASCPTILTVHDIIPLVVDGYFKNYKKRARYLLSMHSALRRARAILTDAESTKRDLMRYFKTPSEKIRAVPLGIEDRSLNSGHRDDLLKEFGITGDYIVNIGSFDPRRNACTLIKAFCEFSKNGTDNACLVLTGGHADFYSKKRKLELLAEKLGVHTKIIFTGYLPQGQMDALVANAKIMVHTSLYEGFGFPVLEAMNCGVPVITSNRGSLPEVAGDAAYLIDPTNTQEIADAIGKVWSDRNLHENFIRKGRQRVHDFSWARTAGQTLDVYTQVITRGKK